MKQEIKNGTIGGTREILAQNLPLEAPYLLQIFPVYGCNFRCGYCIHSLPREQHGYLSNKTFMDMELFQKTVDDMALRNAHIKMLRFAAIGEPLLHKNIAEMVAYAKQSGIADSIDIVSNASLLTKELSDQLAEAGLSRFRISLEGLCKEDYEKHAGAAIDFEQMVENIAYLYNHCKDTRIYIKIIDYMVQDPNQQKTFFERFQPICHDIAIEHLTPTIHEIDYDELSQGMEMNKAQNGEKLWTSEICSQPFYMMQVNPDGYVVPCCSMKYPVVLGNVNEENILDIWNGENFNSFRRSMLCSVKNAGQVCRECKLYLYDMHPQDRLDKYKEELLFKYRRN